VEVAALLTAMNRQFQRVAVHAVRKSLLDAQAQAAGFPPIKVPIPYPCPNAQYEKAMEEAMSQARAAGVYHVVFGDLFLEDIRKYREQKLAGCGMQPLFPIWGLDTEGLARQTVEAGLRAYVTCVDPRKLSRVFAGRLDDAQFLTDLPAGIDPCGGNGEFHTFACAGPMFRAPIAAQVGETIERDGFIFADLIPADFGL
jgi:diphthamide synthase (EF-2-diphthine--ammonia ligase)